MKTIGIIGGMSWESSLEYYRIINEAVKARLGGYHSADCLMYSVDFHEIEAMQRADDWDAAGTALADAARRLERGGAEVIILATNTMHLVANDIVEAVDVPFIHIADATADAVRAAGVGNNVLLLGTRFTMEGDFIKRRMMRDGDIRVSVPIAEERTVIHDIIYDELVQGEIRDASRAAYLDVIRACTKRGAAGVIFGCTEIGLLVQQEHVPIPAFDTTRIHALAAVDFALA
ncbi:MAG: aspartate/glutamate racemase family protein [Chloroflexota bacterium]